MSGLWVVVAMLVAIVLDQILNHLHRRWYLKHKTEWLESNEKLIAAIAAHTGEDVLTMKERL